MNRKMGAALTAAGLLALGGCASTSETPQGRTATEQLLMARAIDTAASQFTLPVPKGSKVFVDASSITGEQAGYTLSALRGAVSGAGYALAPNAEASDAVMEVRAGSLALEQMRRLAGLPQMVIPINETLNVVSIPEVSIYSRRDRIGVAEFSAFVYEPRTGAPLGVMSTAAGEYRIRSHKLLMVLSWGQQRVAPGEWDYSDGWKEF